MLWDDGAGKRYRRGGEGLPLVQLVQVVRGGLIHRRFRREVGRVGRREQPVQGPSRMSGTIRAQQGSGVVQCSLGQGQRSNGDTWIAKRAWAFTQREVVRHSRVLR